MKFSYNWIRQLVESLDIDPHALEKLVTMKTAESEGIEPVGAHLNSVCVARVESVEPIPGSHNRKAVVETGRYGRKGVVCGAPNCRPSMLTAYVPAGTALPGCEIRIATIDGVESDGMLASGAELGLNRDAAGILDLSGEVGAPIPGCLPDSIIEIDNKSITHRPDLWGHHGLAREVAAITRGRVLDPVQLDRIPSVPAPIRVSIEDFGLCPRYSALVFENVTVGPSPLWLQYRLEAIGLNPINNIVDVTNFVMAELAQPMHAFDRDILHGDTIFVRRAREGELLVALNEESYKLDPQSLVIADAKAPVALAGVIGGLDSAIGERTTRLVLESANFHAGSIRKTSSRLRLRTDASMRFEKAQDPLNTVRGLARALELLEQVSPGIRLVGGLADSGRELSAPPPILLPLDWLERKLGRRIDGSEVRDILERLQFGVSEAEPGTLSVTVPSWRATKDISIKDDLVEEVGRMVGYDSITPRPPAIAVVVPHDSAERLYFRHVRTLLAGAGFTEVHNYSFNSEQQVRAFGFEPADHLALANPIAEDQNFMRKSLLPGIWKNLQENSRHFDAFRLFEVGREIHKQPEGLPQEIPHLAAAIYSRQDGAAGLLELKRVAECLLPGGAVTPARALSYEHPARTVEVIWQGAAVGRLFELHPRMLAGRAAILDLDLELVQKLRPPQCRFRPIRRFPSSAFDLSIVAPLRGLVGEIEQELRKIAGDSLDAIEYLRQYTGPPIPEGMKSVSYRLTVAAEDHTLSLEEAGQIRNRIIEGMKALGYDLRI